MGLEKGQWLEIGIRQRPGGADEACFSPTFGLYSLIQNPADVQIGYYATNKIYTLLGQYSWTDEKKYNWYYMNGRHHNRGGYTMTPAQVRKA